jgi:hypothetical protein
MRLSVVFTAELTPAERAMAALPERLKQLPDFMARGVAPLADRMLRRHWDSKGAAFGHPWAPLAESTLRSKMRRGTASKGILRDSDDLLRAMFSASTRRVTPFANGARLRITPPEPIYALFHQLGTARMPARQVVPIPFPNSFIAQVKTAVRAFLFTGRTA